MLPNYSKLYALGHRALRDLFDGPVLVEEKVDGSQFSWGLVGGVLECRSKGVAIDMVTPNGMFTKAVDHVKSVAHLLVDGWVYRGEYLAKPKHNVLAYDRHPAGHLALFDVEPAHCVWLDHAAKAEVAATLGVDVVTKIHEGETDAVAVGLLLDRVSMLGGAKVEGVVVKNYAKHDANGDLLVGKFVSADFKEVHKKVWGESNPGSGDIIEQLAATYRTPARWAKAVQHLAERGELTDSPADIGKLIVECQRDTREECGEEIRDTLFKWAWGHVSRKITYGLPDYYKARLAADD